MTVESTDVIVIGAGAAGLEAARQLADAGLRVLILEGRNRVGGRIWTTHTPSGVPVELGAEFVHGRPRNAFGYIRSANLDVREFSGAQWIQLGGKLQRKEDFFAHTKNILDTMSGLGADHSFASFLDSCESEDEAKLWGLEYVEGFHGAIAERISVHSLIRGRKAEQDVDGHRSFRFVSGYESLLQAMKSSLSGLVSIRLNTVVEVVRWSKHEVRIQAQEMGESVEFNAPRAIVTLPLGVLQAPPNAPGAVRFEPALQEKLSALLLLFMGQTMRVSLVFKNKWWEQVSVNGCKSSALRDLSTVFSLQEWFPTWWTGVSFAPILTGWAASRRGERLSGRPGPFIKDKAIESLSSIFETSQPKLEAMLTSWHVHDWEADPYSRGSYSYVGVDGEGAQAELVRPLDDTLFFAGEATNTEGQHGTVHGAIATGERAAWEILD